MFGCLVAHEVRRPHLVLADAGAEDRLLAGERAEPLHHELRRERAVLGVVVAERVGLLHPGQEVDPALVVAGVAGVGLRLEGDDEVTDHLAAVAHDRDVGDPVLADLGGVDVGVDDPRAGREGVQVAGHPVVEPGTQADDQVAALEPGHGRDRAVHAGHAEVLRVAVRERTTRHQGRDDRDAGEFGEHRELARRAGADGAATDVQDRAAGLEDQPGRLANLLGVWAGHRAVAGQVQLGRPRVRRGGLQRGLGDVDQHRAGPPGGGDVERLRDGARDLGRVGHEEVVLGDRHRDATDVRLLEGVRADRGRADLAGDRDHRDRVHVRVGEGGDQVGRARARGGHAHAHRPVAAAYPCAACPAPCSWRTRMCRMRAVHQRVVRREDGAAGDPEDVLVPAASSDLIRLCAPVIGVPVISLIALLPRQF